MRRQSGFTLLEMLVVLSLLGMLLGLIGTFLLSATASQAKSQRFSARLDEIRAAQQYLRMGIAQALPVAAGSPAAGQPVRFIGEAEHMVFFAPLPDALGGGLYQQQVSHSEHRLLVRFALLDGQALAPVGEFQPLLGDVEQVSFSYRGLSPLAQDSGWLTAWPWPQRLPRQVRIQARLGGPVAWVTEEVNLHLDLASEPDAG
ncbi:prepilin-type N-terminal cleavage/methylation domain-containing protein [Pseudomonas sp. dw_358]|uniref:prepilin-type N-terminal cleavage/methylation domain-containing protein n=1 Tax=Pseudomonas sp. dw_358 TaxID=2720083 RepID=UPI001BD6A87D|nr:prepilin-type N-terminal cleavage/methylation domain-containing protein [Pseudomonas sp. dw_358]